MTNHSLVIRTFVQLMNLYTEMKYLVINMKQ